MEQLRFGAIVRVEHNYRPACDQRRRVQWVIATYYDEQGNEYRKGFYGQNNGARPSIPIAGSHEQLNAFAKMQLRSMRIKA